MELAQLIKPTRGGSQGQRVEIKTPRITHVTVDISRSLVDIVYLFKPP